MSQPAPYTEFHPRWHRRPVSTYWWLKKAVYLKFILREMSSLFIFCWIAVMLAQISALSRGGDAYARWQDWMKSPLVIAFNALAFFFIVFHAVTWFNLAPKAMKVRMGGRPVPALWIAGSNYALWLIVSLIVLLVLL